MTWDFLINQVLLIGAIIIVLVLVFMIAMFIFATAMYIFPAKQIKHDLRQIEENEIESRLYLDEYKFTIANQQWQKQIDDKTKVIKDLDSKIRKKAAELRSLNSKVDPKPKVTRVKKK